MNTTNKASVEMRNWVLHIYKGRYYLSGDVEEHPVLGKGFISQTSSLVNYAFKDNILTYETNNTIYICPIKFINLQPYRNIAHEYVEELLQKTALSDNILDKIVGATARISLKSDLDNEFVKEILYLSKQGQKEIDEREEKDKTTLCNILKEYDDNSIFLRVTDIDNGDRIAYHFGSCVGTLEPCLHEGMLQDSVLYTKCCFEGEDDCSFDFRYFPKNYGSSIETYSWSDNIAFVIIFNKKNNKIDFNGITIFPEETKVFTNKSHTGLLSPDCYNGKSVTNDWYKL